MKIYIFYTCEKLNNEQSSKMAKLIPKIFEELDIHNMFLKTKRKKGNWEEVGEGEKET